MSCVKIAMVLPYFGKLPNYFPLFLRSVQENSDFTLLLFSDANLADYSLPANVIAYQMTFNEIQSRIRSVVSHDVCIRAPYKLCDYKPLYGAIFSHELSNFDFWGHCDADMLWGRLNRFLPDELFDCYDKLFIHGHFSIYRNVARVNNLALEYKDAPCGLAMACSTDLPCYFDEVGMANVVKLAELPTYRCTDFADITPVKYKMTLAPICSYKNEPGQRFFWRNGQVLRTLPNGLQDEFMYIHLQKRVMAVAVDSKRDDVWEIQEDGFRLPGAKGATGFPRLVAQMRQEGGFQLSRIKRLSPERIRLSSTIKAMRETL